MIIQNITDMIGNTPLLKINDKINYYAKKEGFNCNGSEVVGATLSSEGDTVLVVSENGYGKRSKFEDYRLTSRGKKGVSTINITEKTGKLMCMRAVTGQKRHLTRLLYHCLTWTLMV